MPFDLKKVGATYQRLITIIVKEMLGNFIVCFVDDLVVKTRQRDDYLEHLQAVFDIQKISTKDESPQVLFRSYFGQISGFCCHTYRN